MTDLLLQALDQNLLAVYLHGSACASGLRPESDLDVLVVSKRSLTVTERKVQLDRLLALSPPQSGVPEGRRRLEVVVVVTGFQGIGVDPSQADFVYGEWLRDDFIRGSLPMPHNSPDMILLLAQARETAVPLFGAQASVLLPVIPTEAIRTALSVAASEVMAVLEGDERNVLLTLARIWWTAAQGTFVSKDEAAKWAASQMDAEVREVLELSRRAYLGKAQDDWNTRQDAARRTAETLHDRIAESLRLPSTSSNEHFEGSKK